ncbi:MAG TPA: outer membrane beta-barrel protein [Bryobacteraceae bacterium]|nr:outer membrane beta-barrel protein [Bryobacteraceae bacterium]
MNFTKLAVILVLGAMTPRAFSQSSFEIQPFAGFRFGGTIRTADDDPLPIKVGSSPVAGATFTYGFDESFGLEFLWAHQSTRGMTAVQKANLRLDQFLVHVVLNMREREKSLQPFLLGGAGATHASGATSISTKVAWSVGGGIKYFVSRHFGFRLQARYAPTELYSTPLPDSDSYCSGITYCGDPKKQHDLSQGEVTAGWIFRFP